VASVAPDDSDRWSLPTDLGLAVEKRDTVTVQRHRGMGLAFCSSLADRAAARRNYWPSAFELVDVRLSNHISWAVKPQRTSGRHKLTVVATLPLCGFLLVRHHQVATMADVGAHSGFWRLGGVGRSIQ